MKHVRADYNERIQDSAGLIPDDEPVFLVRGQDLAALATIDAWIDEARRVGAEPEMIESGFHHRDVVEAWQAAHGAKVPDAPPDVL